MHEMQLFCYDQHHRAGVLGLWLGDSSELVEETLKHSLLEYRWRIRNVKRESVRVPGAVPGWIDSLAIDRHHGFCSH